MLGLIFALACYGHGTMNFPPPRASQGMDTAPSFPGFQGQFTPCVGDACLWYQVGCYIGCPTCSCRNKEMYPTPEADAGCTDPDEPTLPLEARTWNIEGKSEEGDFTKYSPWRKPGSAPVQNSCGVASGFVAGWKGAEVPMGKDGTPFQAFMNGTDLPPLENVTTVWEAGKTASVSWSIAANHGGGYQYRLCPKNRDPNEDCFREMPLEFVGNTTVKYMDGSMEPFKIPVVDVATGTTPAGSTWRRNPIPACNCDLGADCDSYGKHVASMFEPYEIDPDAPTKYAENGCPTGLQFEPAWDKGYGYGGTCLTPKPGDDGKSCTEFKFNLVDTVQVPKAAGEYILQFRWDCEQTSQVWNQCADITIA